MFRSISSMLKNNRTQEGTADALVVASNSSAVGTHDSSLSYQPQNTLTGDQTMAPDLNIEIEDITILHQSENAVVDVVAVHGLGGHPYQTWQHKNGKMWLKDFLPASFERSRIMTFGYDSDIRSKSTAGIEDKALDLLQAIDRKRYKDKDSRGRPIVFVCHSLGGIIVKRAITLAFTRSEKEYGDIDKCPKSIAFLGVPHQGADIAKWASRIASIGGFAGLTNSAFVKSLERNSRELDMISDDFADRVTKLEGLLSFYETHPTSGIMIVDKNSATREMIGKKRIPVDRDHREICKVGSANDKVVQEIERLIQETVEGEAQSSEKSESLAFLDSTPPPVINFIGRDDIIKKIEHIFSSTSEQRIVILRGMGGQGKTQTALKLCTRRQQNDQSCVCFFIDASSRDSIRASFQSYAQLVGGNDNVSTMNEDAQIQHMQGTLGKKIKNWLLVLDNHDEPRDFPINKFIPNENRGNILITTRRRRDLKLDNRAGVEYIDLPGLDVDSAAELLIIQTERSKDVAAMQDARKIVRALGNHALAIDIAASVIKKYKMEFLAYLQNYNEENQEMSDDTSVSELGDVWKTLQLSWKKLGSNECSSQTAKNLLRFLAFFGNNIVSESYFTRYIDLKSNSSRENSSKAERRPEYSSDPRVRRASSDDSEKMTIPFEHSLSSESLKELDSWLQTYTTHNRQWNHNRFLRDCYSLSELSLIDYDSSTGSKFVSLSIHPLVKQWIRMSTKRETAQRAAICTAILLGAALSRKVDNATKESFLLDKNEQLLQIHGMNENNRVLLSKDEHKLTLLDSRSTRNLSRDLRKDYMYVARALGDYLSNRASHSLSVRYKTCAMYYAREIFGDTSEEALKETIDTVFQCFYAQDHDRVEKLVREFDAMYSKLLGDKEQSTLVDETEFRQNRESLFWLRMVRGQFNKAQSLLHEKGEELRKQARKSGLISGDSPEDQETQWYYWLGQGINDTEALIQNQVNYWSGTTDLKKSNPDMFNFLNSVHKGLVLPVKKLGMERLEQKYSKGHAKFRLFPFEHLVYKTKKSVDHLAKVLSSEEVGSPEGTTTTTIALKNNKDMWTQYSRLRHAFFFLLGFYLLRGELDNAEDIGFHSFKMSTMTFGDDEVLMKLSFIGYLVIIRRKRSMDATSEGRSEESRTFWEQCQKLWQIGLRLLQAGLDSGEPDVFENVIPWAVVVLSLKNDSPPAGVAGAAEEEEEEEEEKAEGLQQVSSKDAEAEELEKATRDIQKTLAEHDDSPAIGIGEVQIVEHQSEEFHAAAAAPLRDGEHTSGRNTGDSKQTKDGGADYPPAEEITEDQTVKDASMTTVEVNDVQQKQQQQAKTDAKYKSPPSNNSSNSDSNNNNNPNPTTIATTTLLKHLSLADPLDCPRLLAWLQMFAAIFQQLGFTTERIELGKWMTWLSEHKLSANHPLTASNKRNLALALHDGGRLREAVEALEWARDPVPDTLDRSMEAVTRECKELLGSCEREMEGGSKEGGRERGVKCECKVQKLPVLFVDRRFVG